MINTRRTIFKTLQKRIRELTKHAQLAPKDFKKIIIAVILNDLKEWAEYIPNDDSDKIVNLLENYLIKNCFILDRIPVDDLSYVNVNTSQNNNTWSRIWDKECSQTYKAILKEPQKESWEPDPNCETKLVYFIPVDKEGNTMTDLEYLEDTYGEYGQKLKTICDKMNVFINRSTGEGWYLNTNCEWKPIENKSESGLNREQVEQVIESYKVVNTWNDEGTEIHLGLSKNVGVKKDTLDLLTTEEVEDLV